MSGLFADSINLKRHWLLRRKIRTLGTSILSLDVINYLLSGRLFEMIFERL